MVLFNIQHISFFTLIVLSITSLSTFADNLVGTSYESFAPPKIEEIEVRYFNQKTNTVSTDVYSAQLIINGAVNTRTREYQSGDIIFDKMGYYELVLKGQSNNDMDVLRIQVDPLRNSINFEDSNPSVNVALFSFIYAQVPELLERKYADKENKVLSVILLGVDGRGEGSFFEDQLKVMFFVKYELLAIPEKDVEIMVGLKYKKAYVSSDLEIRSNSQHNYSFINNKFTSEIGYKFNRNTSLSAYYESEKLVTYTKYPSVRDRLSDARVGLRMQFLFGK